MSSWGMQREVATSLKEGEELRGWDKETVSYAIKYKNKLMGAIRKIIIKHGAVNKISADDVYDELMLYLYNREDYRPEKAISRITAEVVSLEGYVYSCARYCVLRLSTEAKGAKVQSTVILDDGQEIDLMDNISDCKALEEYEDIGFGLAELCEQYRAKSVVNGIDLYCLWFVTLMCQKMKRKDVSDILDVLGMNKKDIRVIYDDKKHQEMVTNLCRAIVLTDINQSIEIFRKYVHGAKDIEELFA